MFSCKAFIICTLFVAGAYSQATYEWDVVMGSCTHICGPYGVQPSLVFCKNTATSLAADAVHCTSDRPTTRAYPCNRRPCSGQWVTGSFGDCPDICNGMQTREVYCNQLQADNRGIIRVDDDQCDERIKPATQQLCGTPCSAPKFRDPSSGFQPLFPVPPEDVVCTGCDMIYVRRGNALRIDVVFERKGVPEPTVTWTLPDESNRVIGDRSGRIRVLENASLLIESIQLNDEGTYVAKAENEVGKDTTNTTVFVVEKPLLKTPISSGSDTDIGADVTIHAGESLYIHADLVRAATGATFVWTTPKGRVLQSGESTEKITTFENGTLKIVNVQSTEAGLYEVAIEALGGSLKASTRVTVIDYEWVSGPAGACSETCGTSGVRLSPSVCVDKVSKSSALESRCIVAGLEKPPASSESCNRIPCRKTEFIWETDEWEPISCQACRDIQSRPIQCYQIEKDLASGNYSRTKAEDIACTGYPKPLGNRICNESFCLVAPRFRVPPTPPMPLNKSTLYNRYDLGQNIIGVQGRSLYIDAVLAKGFPNPNVTWTLQNGEVLKAGESSGRFQVFENGTLRIESVRFEDRGFVKTKAINSEGKDHVVSPITVYVAPIITSLKGYRNFNPTDIMESRHLVARPGDTVALQCQYFGSPTPEYRWMRNGVPVAYEGRFKTDSAGCLIITGAIGSDSDVYTCVAKNAVGVDQKSVTLEVKPFERQWVRTYLPCSVDCGGGTRLLSSECRDSVTNFRVSNSDCKELQRRPVSMRVVCNTMPCVDGETVKKLKCNGDAKTAKPTWIALDWSPCSRSCGKGKQRRKTRCVNPCTLKKAKGCNKSERPIRHRKCNVSPC